MQCRYLTRIGYAEKISDDTFGLAADGERHLEGESKYSTTDGWLDWDSLLELPDWRLREFDALDPTVIKVINSEFFDDSEYDYGLIRQVRDLTRSRIWNVKEWKLNRLLEEFPRAESLTQQCAHWMRAIVGVHFFPDANHRTGMATLYGLLDSNNVAPPTEEWPGENIDRAVLRSKLLRSLHSDVTFRSLWVRDELYYHWHRYFRDLLRDVDGCRPPARSIETLSSVLDHTREQLLGRK